MLQCYTAPDGSLCVHQVSQQLQAAHFQQQMQLQAHQQVQAAQQQQQMQQLNAAQLDRVAMLAQAAASTAQSHQTGSTGTSSFNAGGTANSSFNAGQEPSPPGSVVGGGGLTGGFPGFAALSHPMLMTGGAANLGMGLGIGTSASPSLPLGYTAPPQQTPELNALVAHFENALVAASGGVQTPALLAQAQQAARQHLASQQLALRLAQNPLSGEISIAAPPCRPHCVLMRHGSLLLETRHLRHMPAANNSVG